MATPTVDRADVAERRREATHDRHGLEIVGPVECLELMRRTEIGRIGLCEAGMPIVLPVNYLVEGDGVLIRTGTGALLRAAAARAAVVVETDGVERAGDVAWSVVLRGVAVEATHPKAAGRAEAGRLWCWGRRAPSRLVRIRNLELSGRRLHLAELCPSRREPALECGR